MIKTLYIVAVILFEIILVEHAFRACHHYHNHKSTTTMPNFAGMVILCMPAQNPTCCVRTSLHIYMYIECVTTCMQSQYDIACKLTCHVLEICCGHFNAHLFLFSISLLATSTCMMYMCGWIITLSV